jgi:ATP-dependent RNA helicase DHX57
MGKSKKGKTAPAAASAAKCVCDHPFNCFCGNRPERPSRGHKWDPDTQQWGGKGHKQKGGSGQTGDVAQQATTTQVGQTHVSQWQKLPSALLKEFCQKQKRPPPKFKQILNDNSKQQKVFKVRCIVPDAKDSDKDLILFPQHPVGNEEQAKEEAALLALMHVTPNLPHERKLPEPYRTTWLNALQAQREQAKQTKSSNSNGANNNSTSNNNNNNNGGANNKPSSANNAHTPTTTSTTNSKSKSNNGDASLSSSSSSSRAGGASASTNLTMATRHVSAADRRKQRDAKTKERNTRLRRHEAIRMANRDHPVFMSANLRLQITRLLQGDDPQTIFLENPVDDETAAAELETFESDRQAYVEERLHQEGFTKRQARTAFQNLSSKFKGDEDDEDLWEGLYDECLQWLCVHLNEDQLPEGFDPREQTLEVVAHGNKTSSSNDTSKSSKKEVLSAEAQQLASIYGLSDDDAVWLLWNAAQKDDGSSVEVTLWKKVSELANLAAPTSTIAISQSADDSSHQVVQDEMEALEAMFPEDCQLTTQQDGLSTISIQTSEELSLSIVFVSGAYPSVLPQRVLCSGKWPQRLLGVAFHVELAKFLSTLALGEPMVFELYGQMQLLLQTLEELPEMSLSRKILPPSAAASQTNAKQPNNKSKKPQSARSKLMLKRPRARGVFWSMHPTKTPPAVAFPRLSKSLELQRKGLPAGKARQEFLSILKEADKSSRVVLVTGDTGCGKTTQIPQFILEEAPVGSKIVVAQPRRLAATGVAARVADERGEDKPGKGSVGYVVRGDSAICKNTRLLFCTFGILLRQLQCDGALDNITHIVIDEVHERNLDGDVLMALLKQCLDSTPNLRVILMSATLDADRFAAYWGKNTPRLHIPGRTFPVEDYMLEDVLTMTGYIPPKKGKKKYFGFGNNEQRPRKSTPWNDSEKSDNEEEEEVEEPQEMSSGAKSTQPHGNMPPLEERLKRVDESHIDYDILGQLVKHLVREKVMGADGSILVFLPGAGEINQAKTAIGKITGGLPIMLLPLHGGLQPREQNIVFRPSPNAVKVILSTNVAETSITIPDCTVVIDTCREKQSSYDPVNRMPLLIEVFASRSSLKQRRGRAGRVREGKCYKLISKSTHAKLHEHTAPEITRCALDQILLSLLFLGVERGNGTFLRTLLDPPRQKSVDAATFSLWKIGALERVEGNELRLTPLGMHLAGIPAPPVVGKSKGNCSPSNSTFNIAIFLPLFCLQCLSWGPSLVAGEHRWRWQQE